MAESCVFDAWAWMEVLGGTRTGERLRRRYLDPDEAEVFTVEITLAELSARFAQAGKPELAPEVVDTVLAASTAVLAVGRDDAIQAGRLRADLRARSKRDASLVDAVVLSVARNRGMLLVSGDRAYEGQPDVVGAA